MAERHENSFKPPRCYLLGISFCCIMAVLGVSHMVSIHSPQSYNDPYSLRPTKTSANTFLDDKSEYDQFLYHSFSSGTLQRPGDSQLAPNLQGYPDNLTAGINTFLKSRLFDHPERSNYLSKNLRTSIEVIREAQRIHYNMFVDAIGQFKYCMLLDTADFENKGDPAITVGEMLFLARMGLDLVYYCSVRVCGKDKLNTAISVASKYSPDELVILLHGGGNINIYKLHDDLRVSVFDKLRGYKFFMFPQSVYLKDNSSNSFQRCISMYCCNENLTFVLRDYQSYDIARKYFNGTSRLLVAPDMAFHIGLVKRFMPPVFDILWIKRNDGETPGYKAIPSYPPHLRVHVSDWLEFFTPNAGVSLEKSIYVTVMGLFFAQRGRVVVTDRLHGHILATLLDIPHVLLDNKAKKLSSYHNSWTRGVENTRLTDNKDQAMKLALELLNIYGDHLPQRAPWLNISETLNKINFSVPDTSFS